MRLEHSREEKQREFVTKAPKKTKTMSPKSMIYISHEKACERPQWREMVIWGGESIC